jgi:hypothetical protein
VVSNNKLEAVMRQVSVEPSVALSALRKWAQSFIRMRLYLYSPEADNTIVFPETDDNTKYAAKSRNVERRERILTL